MAIHAITGRAQVHIAGEVRTLACDMNCAAALFEAKGEGWPEWLVSRFLGAEVKDGRRIAPLSPGDSITALYALLATDREDAGRAEETEKTLRRSIPLQEMGNLQMAMMRVVLVGFGVPGEEIEAVIAAVGAPRKSPAGGIGSER